MNIKGMYLKYKEQINYVIVGALTTVVSLLSYYLCVITFLDASSAWQLQVANIISWICAVTFAFFANRKYVFESSSSDIIGEIFRFVSARVTTLVIDMVCMAIFVSICGINDKIAKIMVQFIILILNYVLSKFFVFTTRKK